MTTTDEQDLSGRQADRRRQIIGAVASCVSEEGMAAVTLRNIARRVGATTGMLTHYYGSRTALLKEASAVADHALRERVTSHPDARPGFGWLCALFEEAFNPTDPAALPWSFWLEYWASAERDTELGLHSLERLDALRRDVERCIRACIDDGTFRVDLEPRAAAQAVVAFLHGLGVEFAIRHQPVDARSRAAFRVLVDGFRAH